MLIHWLDFLLPSKKNPVHNNEQPESYSAGVG